MSPHDAQTQAILAAIAKMQPQQTVDLSVLPSVIAAVVAGMKPEGSQTKGSVGPPPDPARKAEDDLSKAIVGSYFFDPRQFSQHSIDRKILRGAKGVVKKTAIGDNLFITTGGTGDEFSEDYNWAEFRSGFQRALRVASEVRPSVVTDWMRWHEKVTHFKCATNRSRCKYSVLFIHKYCGRLGWDDLFVSDQPLMLEHLFVSDTSGQSSSVSSRSDTGKPGNKRGHQQQHPGRGGRAQGQKRQRTQQGSRPCFSRLRRSQGACKFSHDCFNCGMDHSAKDCPSWDQSKVDAKCAALGIKP